MLNINIVNIAYNFLFTVVRFALKSFYFTFGSVFTGLEAKRVMFMEKLHSKLTVNPSGGRVAREGGL